ncbi:MAG: hypothetical protein J5933_06540 [Clostridia bacterium]|nr:hypothetical protein [Clostridia bacterium]
MKKILCIILAVLFVCFTSGCGQTDGKGNSDQDSRPADGSSDQDTTVPDENTIYYVPDELPDDLNYHGESVVFLVPDDSLSKTEICVEELMSEPVNDSIFNREKYVEDRLNVDISSTVPIGDYNDAVTLQHASGDNNFQIIAAKTVWFSPLVFEGFVADLLELDYIDWEKPWWSDMFSEEAAQGGKLFMATGSLALSTNRFLFGVYYNKRIADDYSANYPELEDMYSVVEKGEWTYDMLKYLSENLYTDLDGDSERSEDDFYGFGILLDFPLDVVWSSFDLRMLGKDEDGWFTFDVNQEKCFDILNKMQSLIFHTQGAYSSDGTIYEQEQKFANGGLLFLTGQLRSAETKDLRNMQDDYGLIPFPKYDKAQSRYYSYAHDQYLSFSVPITNPDPDMAAAVLEAMASYSYRDTVPVYLDLVIKGKYMSDARSRKMVDLIVDGFRIDAGWIYTVKLDGIGPKLRDAIRKEESSFASDFVKTKSFMNLAVKEIKKNALAHWD